MAEKKLFLLDAMALIYRAFYALNKNPRINSKGLNTSAILGFANTLFDVIRNEKPTHIGVAFDTAAPTQRHIDFTAYKAHREEMPEDLALSLPYIQRLIDAFNIPVIIEPGFEADDIIGTLARKAETHGFITYMMTSDKDFGQLVTEKTLIYKPAKFGNPAEVLGIKEVCEKFAIERPEQVKDILGLWGDASDNIPGIPGVGEVIAKKLIAEFGSVENLIAKASDIKNEKLREKVITFKDQALLSKQLATIILDVPVPFEEEKLILQQPDREKIKTLFDELEFRTFAQRLFTWMENSSQSAVASQQLGVGVAAQKSKKSTFQPEKEGQQMLDFTQMDDRPEAAIQQSDTGSQHNFQTISTTPHSYFLVDNHEKRSDLITKLITQTSFCFDTETTGIDANNSELVGMSFSFVPFEAYYIPIPDNYHDAMNIVREFKPVFEDGSIEKVGQNIKFDISILKWYETEVKGAFFDTMLAHYLIQPDSRHNMDFLAETYLHYRPVPIEHLIGKKGQGQLTMRSVDTALIKEYASEDADVTLQLKNVFEPLLTKTNTRELFDKIEVPLIAVLASMEAEGVRLDSSALNDYSSGLETEIKILEKSIYELAGVTFNISSPKQLGEILFTRLTIVDNPRQTRTKQFSTGEDVLSKLVNKHPIIEKILEYRSLTKLKSTYVDVLPTLVNPRDNRIHTSYNQAVAATGRLSSNNPNLQNIPIRTEKGREIRKAFVPRNDDHLLLSADYSQVELRIIAHLSGDDGMKEDFRSGVDIHASTAAKVYGVPLDQVTKEMRRNAKAVNFGIIYGMSSFGLSERLNIPRNEAAEIIRQYFSKYPGIKTYIDQTILFAKKHGYVETMMKRRRYLRDIVSNNATVRGFAERNAVNAPIQGTAADMIKIAMIDIFKEFSKKNVQSKMILQVHDELVFDVVKSEVNMVKLIVDDKMKNAIKLDVPVEIEMNTGKNWLEAH
ncbi:MAG: DNA polymerase I [Bacteroidetes bacterium]|nr:DNA polymerase I [Bacteroidota bacterium]